jgi:hypothetical protein
MMIEKYPAALQHRINSGYLSVHLECMRLGRSSVISQCIKLSPESIAQTDLEGYLPLHWYIQNTSSSIEYALMMIEKYPAALRHRNAHGEPPLSIECEEQCRSSIISKCIELYPEELDDSTIASMLEKISKVNFHAFAPLLSTVFTVRPMSLYPHTFLSDDTVSEPILILDAGSCICSRAMSSLRLMKQIFEI